MSNVYSNRTLIGRWRNSITLEEFETDRYTIQTKKGNIIMAKYRLMNQNINQPVPVTHLSSTVAFGDVVSFYAPYITVFDGVTKGMLLGGRLNALELEKTQVLVHGCSIGGLTRLIPTGRSAFVICSVDSNDRKDEVLKYNQEFLLALKMSLDDKNPLYVRYDSNCVPGINGDWPLYLSNLPVNNTRWRILPVVKPHITRFEEEGTPVKAQEDFVLNHCASNLNLYVDGRTWRLAYNGKIALVTLKTSLNVHKQELPENLWRFVITKTT